MGSALRPTGQLNVKRIAIVGAGPSGLAVAKFLLAENAFDKIDVFEQQSEVGGVWNYTPNIAGRTPIPQTTPHGPTELPIWPKGAKAPLFSNAMYDHLNTNIPKSLMKFSDQEFPAESLLFPSREDVQEYLVKYSQDVRHTISFSTQVEDIRLVSKNGVQSWELIFKSVITGEENKDNYDAIVVANGHYSVPFIPSVLGIEEFNAKYPYIITHSKVYRSPDAFADKKVIVVGSAASGIDIGTQISKFSKKPLLNSVKSTSTLKLSQESKEEVPPIAEYLINERGVRFEDGRVEKDIDAIVYCTGYLYSYPFLKTLDPPIVTTGRRVLGVYQQLFNLHYPTLAFTAIAQKIIPFPLSEVQGAAIAKVWSNKLVLPEKQEMVMLEKKQVEDLGDGTSFHVLGYPKDADYINGLYDWVKSASDEFGKHPGFWSDRQFWERRICVDLKKKFIETAETATSMTELGFEYEPQGNEADWGKS